MIKNSESRVLEILPQLHNDITDLRNEMTDLRNETRNGFNRVELRLGLIEQGLAGMLSVSASDRDEIRALKQRIERIERRLELEE